MENLNAPYGIVRESNALCNVKSRNFTDKENENIQDNNLENMNDNASAIDYIVDFTNMFF